MATAVVLLKAIVVVDVTIHVVLFTLVHEAGEFQKVEGVQEVREVQEVGEVQEVEEVHDLSVVVMIVSVELFS